MGQPKLNKNKDNILKVNNASTKDHKGDTARSSDQGRKTASGGQTGTNNRGQRKESWYCLKHYFMLFRGIKAVQRTAFFMLKCYGL